MKLVNLYHPMVRGAPGELRLNSVGVRSNTSECLRKIKIQHTIQLRASQLERVTSDFNQVKYNYSSVYLTKSE